MSPSLRPSDIVDRAPEKDTLREMLEFSASHRVLVLTAEEGNGKSTALSLLHWICRDSTPEIPAILVDLKDDSVTEAFSLVHRVRTELIPMPFPSFDDWNDIRTMRDIGALQAKRSQGRVDAAGAIVQGGVVVGMADQVLQGQFNAPVFVQGSTTWTPGVEEWAQERCIDAFFHDLRHNCRERPLVLLLDSYDKASRTMVDWIYRRLVKQYLLDPDGRPERFLVIVGSRPEAVPDFTTAERELVRVRELQQFEERDLVRQFLDANGRREAVDTDVRYAYENLRDGVMSLQKILDLIDYVQKQKTNRATNV